MSRLIQVGVSHPLTYLQMQTQLTLIDLLSAHKEFLEVRNLLLHMELGLFELKIEVARS